MEVNSPHKIILQMCIAAFLVAIAVIVGTFGHFFVMGGQVYLLASVVFLFPVVIRLPLLNITTSIAVVLTDFFTGWVAYTWISLIAYNLAVLVIYVCQLLKSKILYMIGTLVGAAILTAAYYFLEIPIFGHANAIKDLIATAVQMAICLPVVWILYFPFKLITKPFRRE